MKNVVIFSDGTGQRGGLVFDESRSNIYKLYRATRCGPDTEIDPAKQLAYYDPGLGTLPGGVDSIVGLGRSLYNLSSQATGLGILGNIEDCYAALVRLWQPGDRIFLFGFSRGAYTVRCLASVLSLCGLPTTDANGHPLRYDTKTANLIAREAVRTVFDYENSKPEEEATAREKRFLEQRNLLALKFRNRYRSNSDNVSNTVPYFIGVFDTVASLSNPVAVVGLSILTIALLALVSFVGSYVLGNFAAWFGALAIGGIAVGLVWLLGSRVKWACGLKGHSFLHTLHWKSPRPQMYDKSLDLRVSYARHAISLDERRASFPRVKWGRPGEWKRGKPVWFEQNWFAGNHSDIGGSYPENESRLSDVALAWMANSAQEVGLHIDPTLLRTYPNSLGEQHDQTTQGVFKLAGKCDREPRPDAPLHPSVLERFGAVAVLQNGVLAPYRPECLRNHMAVKHLYEDAA